MEDRVLTELVEADVEIGFSLADVAAGELCDGNMAFGIRALAEAENIVVDIEQRLPGLGTSGCGAFRPLVNELRREIDEAKNGSKRPSGVEKETSHFRPGVGSVVATESGTSAKLLCGS